MALPAPEWASVVAASSAVGPVPMYLRSKLRRLLKRGGTLMRAILRKQFGGPDVLEIREFPCYIGIGR
jgi:hypothetical protein